MRWLWYCGFYCAGVAGAGAAGLNGVPAGWVFAAGLSSAAAFLSATTLLLIVRKGRLP